MMGKTIDARAFPMSCETAAAVRQKTATAALFVPYWGCAHRCSFCDQHAIAGSQRVTTPETVKAFCQQVQQTPAKRPLSLGFFGGSFTCIPRKDMVALLKAALPYIKNKTFTGIRVSTRPDALGEEVLEILQNFGVDTVEIGAQSMDDEVLRLNERGHGAEVVIESAMRVKAKKFTLGLQMMTGLYGSDPEKDRRTARTLAALEPDGVRVYPTVVCRGTTLAEHMRAGRYQPMTLAESAALCGELLLYFQQRSIPVWRMGLPGSPELERQVVGGAYHPAFRELAEGWALTQKIRKKLEGQPHGDYVVWVHPGSVSKICGHRQKNLAALRNMGYNITIKVKSEMKSWQEVAIGKE